MKEVVQSMQDDGFRMSVPMTFKKNSGRKRIILPGGAGKTNPSDPVLQKPLLLALARAHRWRRLLEEGRFSTITQLALALDVDSSYVGRILRLTLLAPEIIESILDGREPAGLSLARLTKTLPLDWSSQQDELLGSMAEEEM